ncbi:MAG: pseudouridine synthase [Patescibacteria group bacterium]
MLERLQKILSARGLASRRKAEEYIEAGLVRVNGKVAILGQKADPEKDRIEVDGTVLKERQEMLYYVMQKPVGVETSNIERRGKRGGEEERTVRDLLPSKLQGKIFPVGRLDKDSSGLLLFTNDGALAYRLTPPKFEHEKEYEVVVQRPIPEGAIRKLERGLMIFGMRTKPASVQRLSGRRFRMALTEGRNRQIRRMCQKVGYPVQKLHRMRIVTLTDPDLAAGEMRLLTEKERGELLKAVGLLGAPEGRPYTRT